MSMLLSHQRTKIIEHRMCCEIFIVKTVCYAIQEKKMQLNSR